MSSNNWIKKNKIYFLKIQSEILNIIHDRGLINFINSDIETQKNFNPKNFFIDIDNYEENSIIINNCGYGIISTDFLYSYILDLFSYGKIKKFLKNLLIFIKINYKNFNSLIVFENLNIIFKKDMDDFAFLKKNQEKNQNESIINTNVNNENIKYDENYFKNIISFFAPNKSKLIIKEMRNELKKYGYETFFMNEDLTPSEYSMIQIITNALEFSAWCIFDITFSNPNVMYELGYSYGTKRKNIIICKSTEDNQSIFNINQNKYCLYNENDISHFVEKDILGRLKNGE